MAFRTEHALTPTTGRADQVQPPEPAITNAGSLSVADKARQQMMANEAANSGTPFWSKEKGTLNMPNTNTHIPAASLQKADSDEAAQLKKDGLDPEKPNAQRAREAMIRRQTEPKRGDLPKE